MQTQYGLDRCSITETRPHDEYITTFTGGKCWPTDPQLKDIKIEDIAHALSLLCRWTGHIREFYSVAEHSIRVCDLCSPENKFWGLLHDASEAYLVDLARPIKHAGGFGDSYRVVEARLMDVIQEKFGLVGSIPQEVKYFDDVILRTEERDLMASVYEDDTLVIKTAKPLAERIVPMTPKEAEALFLTRFYQLSPKQL